MTKKENFEMIMATVKGMENEKAIVEFCEKEIASLEKKLASNEKRKANKAVEHEALEKAIVKIFMGVPTATPKEIAEEIGVSVQKVSPRLKALAERGVVKRSTEKKNVFFTLVEVPAEWVEELTEPIE